MMRELYERVCRHRQWQRHTAMLAARASSTHVVLLRVGLLFGDEIDIGTMCATRLALDVPHEFSQLLVQMDGTRPA